MINLNDMLADPAEVEIGDKIYKVEDPGLEGILKMIALSAEVQKDPSKMIQFMSHVKTIAQGVPPEIIDKLSGTQLFGLIRGIGEHFFPDPNKGKPKSPLPDCG